MKRFLVILLAVILVFSLISCAKQQEDAAEVAVPTPVPQKTEPLIEELHALAEPPYYETFDELVLKSDAILIGTAGEASCKRVRDDRVNTHTEFQIRKVIKGSAGENTGVTIVQNGGEADGLRYIVKEAGVSVPYLQEGTDYLLFLSTSSSVPEPAFYTPMNSFVIYELEDGIVSPVNSYSMFITKETPLDLVEDIIENSLLPGFAEYGESEIETIFAYGTPVRFESLGDLVAESDAILIGTAEKTVSARVAETEVRTDTEIRIKEVFKGNFVPDESIIIMQYGGEAEGLRVVEVENGERVPYPQTGTEYLLFLKSPSDAPHETFFAPVNSFEGFFAIEDGKVSPVSFASDFITTPTPVGEVSEQIENCLSQTE